MATQKPALEQIKELQERIKALSADAVATLKGEKRNLQDRIAAIDKEIEALTGEKPEGAKTEKTGKGRGPRKTDPGSLKKPDLQELKDILKGSPDKTLNIRKEGYDTPNIKTMADANPALLQYTKGAWPTVKLLK
jgi:hypothetical protein